MTGILFEVRLCALMQIGDFGMSRNLLDENYYVSKGGLIPLKWTAPEVIIYN